jgi:hypothetical protein
VTEWQPWKQRYFIPAAEDAAAGEPTTGILQRTATGAIWYQDGARVREFEGGRVTNDFSPRSLVRRLFEDTQGRVWLAVEGSDELLIFQDGKLTAERVGDGQPQFRFGFAFEERQGASGSARMTVCYVRRRFILHPCFFNPAKLPRTLSGWYGQAAVFPETAFLQIATSNWKLPSSSSEPVRAVV